MSRSVNACVIVGNGFDLAAGLGTDSEAFVGRFAEQHAGEDSPAGRLATQIRSDGAKTWADFERKLGEYAGCLAGAFSGEQLEQEYLGAKEAVEADLNAFIAEQEQAVDDDYIDACSKTCIASLCGWVGSLAPRNKEKVKTALELPSSMVFTFVTLNYTSVLDQVVGLIRSNSFQSSQAEGVSSFLLGTPVHAHGDLGGNPICGVNDASQIADEELRSSAPVIDTVVKGQTQALFGDMNDARALASISQADVILIYGCSMGPTDRRWWEAVCERWPSERRWERRLVRSYPHHSFVEYFQI